MYNPEVLFINKFLKLANPGVFLLIFVILKYKFYRIKCRLQWGKLAMSKYKANTWTT